MENTEQYVERAREKLKNLKKLFKWLSRKEVASLLDHTLLKPNATIDEYRKFLIEGRKYNFASYCINSFAVPILKKIAIDEGIDVNLCSVAGFPLGASITKSKVFEASEAIKNGATEIDMVMNIGLLKSRKFEEVRADIEHVKREIGSKILKVIIETGYLTDEEKVIATKIVMDSGADFVKTSTGFGPSGATAFDVSLLSVVADGKIKVKAAGGIRNYYTVCAFHALGAGRIGASSSIKIMEEI